MTFDVFKDPEVEEEEQEEVQGSDEEVERPPKEPEEKLPHFLEVKEVVREPRMHYFKVPRLGSFVAIRLEYESCLIPEAFDAGLVDYLNVRQRKKEQEEEKKQWEDQLKEQQEQADAEGDETYHAEEKIWENIEPQPFLTEKVSFVVCLNTLGQDREFTTDERLYALRTIQKYRDHWENIEKENLNNDIEQKLNILESDRIYKEQHEAMDNAEFEAKAD